MLHLNTPEKAVLPNFGPVPMHRNKSFTTCPAIPPVEVIVVPFILWIWDGAAIKRDGAPSERQGLYRQQP